MVKNYGGFHKTIPGELEYSEEILNFVIEEFKKLNK